MIYRVKFLVYISLLFLPTAVNALNVDVHRAINEKIGLIPTPNNDFTLNQYIIDQLGYAKGIKSTFVEPLHNDQLRIDQLLGVGGVYEDEPPGKWPPYRRSRNHFHDPLKPLDQAGYRGFLAFCSTTDNPLLVSGYCPKSAITWATGPQIENAFSPGGDWSWTKTRDNYYKALTSDIYELREMLFADTFRGLGQIAHLLEDMSVPEHARNAYHAFGGYEGYVSKIRKNDYIKFSGWFTNPYFFDMATLVNNASPFNQDATIPPTIPIPFVRLFDSKQYDGTNPDVTVDCRSGDCFINNTIGLSEYTNANFVTPTADSMGNFTGYNFPSNGNNGPYPSSLKVQDYDIADELNPGATVKRPYYQKISDGETGYRVAGVDYFYFYRNKKVKSVPPMDDYVYNDYADRLMPRAVGYAATLLNYYFRGTLQVSAPDEYVYGITDGSQTSPFLSTKWDGTAYQQVTTQQQQFKTIKAKIKNTTPTGDQAGNGTLVAVAEYAVIPNYQPDLSNYPPVEADMDKVKYSYSVSEEIPISPDNPLRSDQATEFTFDFTQHPIPAGITDLSFYFVFKGDLGKEKDNAVAVAWKDMSEPVHQTFWNLTDRYSLDYILRTSAEIQYSSNVLRPDRYLVDLDHNGIYNERPNSDGNMEPYIKPYQMSFEISYSDTDPATSTFFPSASIDNLDPGRHVRLIVLVDNPTNYVDLQFTSTINGESDYYATFSSVFNGNYDGTFTTIPDLAPTFRNVKQHFNSGIVGCAPMAINATTGRTFCPYNETPDLQTDVTPVPVDTSLFLQNVE